MTSVRKAQLIRLGIWTSLATIAMIVAMSAAYTETGIRRIAGLLATEPPADAARTARAPNPQLAARQFDPDLEARRLNEQVRILAADRDRLLTRVTALERSLDDVTGSIPPNTPASRPAPVVPQAALPQAPAPQAAAPLVVPPAAVAPLMSAPPGPTTRMAPPANVTVAGPAQSVATKTDFGIDVGGNVSIDGLRTLWTNLKTSQPTLFEGLRPVIAIRDGGKSGTVELRLIAGPVANAAVAARLCAALSAAGQVCQPAVFDGQRLALQ